MDWQAIAQQVVAILVPVAPVLALAATEAVKALGKKFGEVGAEAALKKGRALWDKIKARFAKDKEVTQTMELFAGNPAAFEVALAKVLEARLKQDAEFGRELHAALSDAVADAQVATFLTQVYDQATVDQIINIGRVTANEVHF